MPNHVIRDRLWASKKLARCSRDAALAYPWIFLVADDHGRFEFHPRRIWGLVFSARHDITAEDVAVWLAEYEREGLLQRYHIDLAVWTGFEGRPEGKRRKSIYPEPEPFLAIDAKPRETAQDRAEPAPRAEQSVAEQSRAETERSGADRAEYVNAIWAEFLRITSRPETELMGTIEYGLASRWWDEGAPLSAVLAGMNDSPRKREARRLTYFAPSVKEAVERQRKALSA